MRIGLFICLLGFALSGDRLSGQYGFQLNSGYNQFSNDNRTALFTPGNGMHLTAGPSFWFRFKNRRIEFNPALLFDFGNYQFDMPLDPKIELKELNGIFNFPILIYPFDFGNDCNCPTFNKQGQLFKKGFYFLVYPSVIYLNQRYDYQLVSDKRNSIAYQIGIGAGLDIGINRKWTFSPGIVFSKFISDRYNVDNTLLPAESQDLSRARLDIILRFMWFAKKKRY